MTLNKTQIMNAIRCEVNTYEEQVYGTIHLYLRKRDKKVALIETPELAILALKAEMGDKVAIVAFSEKGITTTDFEVFQLKRLVVVPALYEENSVGTETYPMIYKIIDFGDWIHQSVGQTTEMKVSDSEGSEFSVNFRITVHNRFLEDFSQQCGVIEGGFWMTTVGYTDKFGGAIRF